MASIKCGKCGGVHQSVGAVRECYNGNVITAEDELTLTNPQPTSDQTEMDFTAEIQRREREEDERVAAYKASRDDVFASVRRSSTPKPSEKQAKLIESLIEDRVGATELLANGYYHGVIDAMFKLPVKTTARTVVNPALTAGRYAIRGADNTIDFYKVDMPEEGKWAGYTFVKQLVGSIGDWNEIRLSRASSTAILDKIALNPEESARLFGQTAKHCGRCMSPLSDPQSRAAGYGEKCASKCGYWYPSRKEALALLGEEDAS